MAAAAAARCGSRMWPWTSAAMRIDEWASGGGSRFRRMALVHTAFAVHPRSRHADLPGPFKPVATLWLSESLAGGILVSQRSDLVFSSGPYRTRTCDPLRVMQVRYQLRQRPHYLLFLVRGCFSSVRQTSILFGK